MSMPSTITLISPSKPEIMTNSTRRDASFSSYLDGAEESFVLKLGNKKSTPNDHVFLRKNPDDDIELDVFGAEKYFNEAFQHHHHNPKPAAVIAKNQLPTHHHHRPKKDDLALEIFAIKTQPPPSQSIRSESSWNSRSSLLQAASRNIDQQQQQPNKKTNKKLGFLAKIGCKCSCADKSSVDVDDTKTTKTRKQAAGPTSSSSLQEFGAAAEMRSGLDKKMSEIKTIPSICGGEESDGGGDSDASSDLFEIESLSRGGGSHHHDPFRRSTSPEAASTCYAPSEASVEWSVVTASAADFDEPVGSNPKIKAGSRLRSTGILSGCMSQNAVRVGGAGDYGRRRNLIRTESFTTSARFHEDEIKFNRQRSGQHVH